MNEELRWRIKAFFDFWRRRYAFVRNLDFKEHNHEANVLLWAHFDALSSLWAQNIAKKQYGKKGKRIIFDAFLATYGGELFQIVSLPHVWNRIDKEDVWVNRKNSQKLSEDVCTFLSKIGERQTSTRINQYQLRQGSADWNLKTIIAETLQRYPETNSTELEEWLTLSRYGAIAYKEMRSAYIHEGRAGKSTHGFDLYESEKRPTYFSGIYTTPPIIGFQVEFMLSVLEKCINAFEADALELQQDPVPEEQ